MCPRTEKWHNWDEGDCGKPIKVGCYYKKKFWKRYDRKKFYRIDKIQILKSLKYGNSDKNE